MSTAVYQSPDPNPPIPVILSEAKDLCNSPAPPARKTFPPPLAFPSAFWTFISKG